MRIALIKVGALGDVVRTTSLLPGLRRLFPAMDLTWITARDALPLVQCHPDVREALPFDVALSAQWAGGKFDWVISLDDDRDVCRLASSLEAGRLSGAYQDAEGELRYTPDVAGWFGMGRLRRPEGGGLVEANRLKKGNQRSYGEILYSALGLPFPVERPSVPVLPAEESRVDDWLSGIGFSRGVPIVGLNTGAGARWRFKSWGLEQTAVLARRLCDEAQVQVLILGGPAESERNMSIAQQAGNARVAAAVTSTDIPAFVSLVAACAVLVSSDSLAMHIGIALKKPVIAFFGPTSDSEIDLFGNGEKLVTALECRTCYLADCDIRPHCMESLSVEAFLSAVRRCL